MRHLSVFAALGALLLNGCFFFRGLDPYEDEPTPAPYEEYTYTYDAEVQEAWVGGDMADLGEFEADAYEATYNGRAITLHAGENGGADFGWAMIRISSTEVEGFEGETFAPGTVIDSASTTGVSAQGCTGPSHGNYDFDGFTDDITIVVEQGPTETSRLFHYTAVFDSSRGGETHGSFVLELN